MTLHLKDFDDAIKWTEKVLIERKQGMESPVFRVTNYRMDIIKALRFTESIEDLMEAEGEIYLPAVQSLLERMLKKAEEDSKDD